MASVMEAQIARLQAHHRVAMPQPVPLPLAEPVDYPLIVEGLASTFDFDSARCAIAPYALSWPCDPLPPLSSTRWGGVVGVGFEYGFAPNWSVGLEYDHLFLGDANNSFSIVNPNVVGVLNSRVTQDVDMVTLRFNYRFGGYGAPIAARY